MANLESVNPVSWPQPHTLDSCVDYRCCCCSVSQLCPTLCSPMDCSTPGFPVSQSLLKLMSIQSVMPSIHLILCRPLLLLPSIFPSIRVFSNESALNMEWPSIGASASPSVLPLNIQDWFPLGLTGLISLQSKGLSRCWEEKETELNVYLPENSSWMFFKGQSLLSAFWCMKI